MKHQAITFMKDWSNQGLTEAHALHLQVSGWNFAAINSNKKKKVEREWVELFSGTRKEMEEREGKFTPK